MMPPRPDRITRREYRKRCRIELAHLRTDEPKDAPARLTTGEAELPSRDWNAKEESQADEPNRIMPKT